MKRWMIFLFSLTSHMSAIEIVRNLLKSLPEGDAEDLCREFLNEMNKKPKKTYQRIYDLICLVIRGKYCSKDCAKKCANMIARQCGLKSESVYDVIDTALVGKYCTYKSASACAYEILDWCE